MVFTSKADSKVFTMMKPVEDLDYPQWDHHSTFWQGTFDLNSFYQEGELISFLQTSNACSCVLMEKQFLSRFCFGGGLFSFS